MVTKFILVVNDVCSVAKRTISVATERIVMATEVLAVVILRAKAFAEYSHT